MTPHQVRRVFAARSARRRRELGWTQRQLASAIGVTAHTVQVIEAAGSAPRLVTAIRIADALKIPLGDLVAPPSCPRCIDDPPEGFTCGACGRAAHNSSL